MQRPMQVNRKRSLEETIGAIAKNPPRFRERPILMKQEVGELLDLPLFDDDERVGDAFGLVVIRKTRRY